VPAARQHVPLDVGRIPTQPLAGRTQRAGRVEEDRAGDHLEHALPGEHEPVQSGELPGGVDAIVGADEAGDGGELYVVGDGLAAAEREAHGQPAELVGQVAG
jgi:hypothetical protein